jgi:phytoene dehydrogenase-like protein
VAARPVVVVGAGLAGLCCALDLARRGVDVQLLEASDAAGGVVRTDRVQGFLLDRGFQVLQTSYPEARCRLDYPSLRLHAFRPGALVRWRGRLRRVGDPFRAPADALPTLRSGIPTLGDAWRVARMRRELARASLDEILTRPGRASVDALRRRGFSERMIRGFFRPLFRGVFLEPELATSSRLLEFAFRAFATGPVCLPAAGMGALPAQLAARLPPGALRLGARVAAVDDAGATLESGERVDARAVVVAAAHPEAQRLLPELPPVASNAVTCVYFDAPEPPVVEPILLLNGDEGGPVSHLCVPSQVAPDYAPARRALVSVSVLGVPAADDAALAGSVREQLRGWFGSQVERWRLLRVDRLPDALPRQTPERFDPATRPVRVAGTRFVCGGHRETASLGGAMRSGRRAARAVLAALGPAA